MVHRGAGAEDEGAHLSAARARHSGSGLGSLVQAPRQSHERSIGMMGVQPDYARNAGFAQAG